MVQVAIASFRQQYNGSWNYIMAASTVVALPTLVNAPAIFRSASSN